MIRLKKHTTYDSGKWAEYIAGLLLVLKGYSILARRYRVPLGEIDIIAKRGRMLVMVEVKARRSLEEAYYAISPKQQQRIQNAASCFMASHPSYSNKDIRFDAILVTFGKWPVHLTHIITA